MTRCVECGALVPNVDGPTHPYMRSSPGCWATYGAVLAREYGNAAYAGRHQLTVDAFAVQHPGEPSRRSARSVMLHLASLCAVFEYRAGPRDATRLLRRLAARRDQPEWMEPPTLRGMLNVADVYASNGAREHVELVERWARSAWDAWSEHHLAVQRFLEGTCFGATVPATTRRCGSTSSAAR